MQTRYKMQTADQVQSPDWEQRVFFFRPIQQHVIFGLVFTWPNFGHSLRSWYKIPVKGSLNNLWVNQFLLWKTGIKPTMNWRRLVLLILEIHLRVSTLYKFKILYLFIFLRRLGCRRWRYLWQLFLAFYFVSVWALCSRNSFSHAEKNLKMTSGFKTNL